VTGERGGVGDGLRAVLPLLIGVVPFGLIFGVVAADSVVGGGLGAASSVIIFAGAAQLAVVQLLDGGAAPLVVIATGLVINARHLMYSAALAPHFREFPVGWRYGLPYVMTDQAFAVSIARYQAATDPRYRRLFFTGAAVALWTTWQITTIVGVVAGTQIPASWSLDFAIPLVFLALLVPTLRDRPSVLAAVVGGVVAVAGNGLPYHSGLIVAALSGVAAGVAAQRWSR
jgi:4-azaleucine resistance transporter AzlC